jgi:hypothetical protein
MPYFERETINTCNGILYDAGGPNEDIYIDHITELTILPDNPSKNVCISFKNAGINSSFYLYQSNSDSTVNYNLVTGKNYISTDLQGEIKLKIGSPGWSNILTLEAYIGCVLKESENQIQLVNACPKNNLMSGLKNDYEFSIDNSNSSDTVISAKVKFYIGNTNNFSIAHIIDSTIIGKLDSGINTYSYSLFLPDTIKEGTYFIFSKLESNMSPVINNIYSYEVKIIEPIIDYFLSSLVFNYNSFLGTYYFKSGITSFDYTLINKGNMYADSFKLYGYLSLDKKISPDDIKVDIIYPNPFDKYLAVKEPDNLKDTLYYFILKLKTYSPINEKDTSNNVIVKQILIDKNIIDLKVNNIVLNNKIVAGQGYVYYPRTEPNIPGVDLQSLTTWYLSNDSIFNPAEDEKLVIDWGNNLVFKESQKGAKYIFCLLDKDSIVNDTNRTNNIYYKKIFLGDPKPEAKISNLNIDISLDPNLFILKYRIYNIGNVNFSKDIKYYISKDTLLDDSDVYLADDNIYLYLNDSDDILSRATFINSNINEKYLLFDLGDTILIKKIEIPDEPIGSYKFDCRSSKIITADSGVLFDNGGLGYNYSLNSLDTVILRPTDVNKKMSIYVKNFECYFGFDDIQVYDADLSKTKYVGSIGRIDDSLYSYRATNAQGAISLVFESGSYYSDKGFKILFDTAVFPNFNDWSFTNISLNQKILYGQYNYAYVNFTLAHSSYIGYSSNVKLKVFLSRDTIISPDDTILQETSISASSTSTSFQLPSNTGLGEYYLLFLLDCDSAYTETNETNNMAYIKISGPFVDNSVKNISSVNSIWYKNIIQCFQADYEINTNTSLGTQSINFYLSKDTVVDSNDSLIYTSQDFYGSNGTISGTYTPFALTEGYYYLIACINNPDDTVKNNNYAWQKVFVKASNYDLSFSSYNVYNTSLHNNDIGTFDFTIHNNGDVESLNSFCNIYISNNTSIDNQDLQIENLSVNVFPDNDYQVSFSYYIPETLKSGANYILFNIVSNDSNKINNFAYIPVSINAPHFALIPKIYMDSVYKDATDVSFRADVLNCGPDNCRTLDYTFYLSADTIVDNNDQILYNGQNTDLIKNGSIGVLYKWGYSFANIRSGNYYLICKLNSPDNTSDKTDYIKIRIINSSLPNAIISAGKVHNDLINIFPNPAHDFLLIKGYELQQLVILNISGTKLISKKITDSSEKIDISGLDPGYYLIYVIDSKGSKKNGIFIKN